MVDRLSTAGTGPVPSVDPRPAGGAPRLVVDAWRSAPWWLRVLVLFALSRVVSTVVLLRFADRQPANAWTLAQPGYVSFATLWDSRWYQVIAYGGYPSTLPTDAAGHVAENAWAFLPGYPLVVRALMELTGAGFPVLSVVVSVVASAATCLVLHRLLRSFLPDGSADVGVLLFCVSPTAPLLQLGYAEPLFLFFLAAALLLFVRRRWWAMLPVVVALSFTRPGALPLALALGVHALLRLRRSERAGFPVRERVAVAVVTVVTGVLGLAWPVVAAVVTGVPGAYEETELSWRSAYIGRQPLVPFTPWFQGADWWLPGGLGAVLVVLLVVAVVVAAATPWVRRLPLELRLWCGAYLLYLFAVWFPQSSTFRILMPLFPLVGALAVPRSRTFRAGLVVVGVVLQWVWVDWCWWIDGADWTPP